MICIMTFASELPAEEADEAVVESSLLAALCCEVLDEVLDC